MNIRAATLFGFNLMGGYMLVSSSIYANDAINHLQQTLIESPGIISASLVSESVPPIVTATILFILVFLLSSRWRFKAPSFLWNVNRALAVLGFIGSVGLITWCFSSVKTLLL